MRPTDILIKYPTRNRPDKFRDTFQKWDTGRVRFIVSTDADDPADYSWLDSLPHVQRFTNPPAGKIAAVNANMDAAGDFDLLILASDDMIPQHGEYDLEIAALFAQHFPDGDGVLHLDDGRVGDRLNTLCIMDKKYFDRFGYIYHPAYVSLWCDNEFMEVSRRLGRARWEPRVLVKHEWDGDDLLCVRNQQWYASDQETFELRQLDGFP